MSTSEIEDRLLRLADELHGVATQLSLDEKDIGVPTFCQFDRFAGSLGSDLEGDIVLLLEYRLKVIEQLRVVQARGRGDDECLGCRRSCDRSRCCGW